MKDSSFVSLLYNISFLLATSLVFDLIISKRRKNASRIWQFPVGLIIGGGAVVLMITPWVYSPDIIFDTRSILLAVSGLYFGPIPTIIAMVIASLFRIFQGGVGAWMGVSVIITSGLIGMVWRRFVLNRLAALPWWQLYLFGLVVHLVMLLCAFAMPLQTALEVLSKIWWLVLLIYPVGTMLLGLILSNNLHRYNDRENLIRTQTRLHSLVKILQHPVESVQEFLDHALNEAINLTDSKIGYIYFYSEDSKEFELISWSRDVMKECAVQDPQSCYLLEKTGIWGEAVRQKKPIMLNDFKKSNPLKKGYPEGHVQLEKFLTIPIFQDEQIVAVVGVANKATDYDENDVSQLTLLMDGVWKTTQRKQAEIALGESEERYRRIVDTTLDGILIVDGSWHLVFMNTQMTSMLGVKQKDIKKMKLEDFIFEQDLKDFAEHKINRESGMTERFEFRYKAKGDREVWAIVSAVPVMGENGKFEGSFAMYTDITNLKTAERTAKQNLETAQAILNAADESVFLMDNNGITIAANETTAIRLKKKMDEIIGVDMFSLLDPETSKFRKRQVLSVIKTGKPLRFEDERDGLCMENSIYPIFDSAGMATQVAVYGRDVSEQKKAEKQIKENQAELQRLLHEAEQSRQVLLSLLEDRKQAEDEIRKLNQGLEDRVRERTGQLNNANKELETFAYSVSHDLRAPLRGLDGYSGLLLADYQDKLDAQGVNYLKHIQESAQKMSQLIEDLLNLSRVTRRDLNRELVNLNKIAQNIMSDFMTQNPQLVINYVIEPEMTVLADANLLKIALENLLNNAVKFSSSREKIEIEFGCFNESNSRIFFIRDNGVGFNMAYVDKLFIPFQRLHSNQEFPGNGIGLVTVQRIINHHGGRIWAESKVNEGATFFFTLGSS
jgi:PAS domain S-box-containing protein